jgi:hypothetical protein
MFHNISITEYNGGHVSFNCGKNRITCRKQTILLYLGCFDYTLLRIGVKYNNTPSYKAILTKVNTNCFNDWCLIGEWNEMFQAISQDGNGKQ